jgi:methylphosphotriester-DNA--protein-cysteine methyltransferase
MYSLCSPPSIISKGSESDTDPSEESHPHEDAASARHAELTALHANIRARTPMVLKSKYDEALQREESLKAELEASRQFVATPRDDAGRAQSSRSRSKSDPIKSGTTESYAITGKPFQLLVGINRDTLLRSK